MLLVGLKAYSYLCSGLLVEVTLGGRGVCLIFTQITIFIIKVAYKVK